MVLRISTENDALVDHSPGKGHNSIQPIELKRIIEHIEGLKDEISMTNKAIQDAYRVADQKGYDRRTIQEMLKLRKLGFETRQEREELRALYLVAIGLA